MLTFRELGDSIHTEICCSHNSLIKCCVQHLEALSGERVKFYTWKSEWDIRAEDCTCMFSAPATCPGICEGLVLHEVLWEVLHCRRQTLETASHHLCKDDRWCKLYLPQKLSKQSSVASFPVICFTTCEAYRSSRRCDVMAARGRTWALILRVGVPRNAVEQRRD